LLNTRATDHTDLGATENTDNTDLRATDHTDNTDLGATDHTDNTDYFPLKYTMFGAPERASAMSGNPSPLMSPSANP